MITVTTYLYDQIIYLQLPDSAVTNRRNSIMYSRPIVVYQGIDNTVQVRVRNQDQKPINMTEKLIQVDVQNPQDQLTEYSLGLVWSNKIRGQGHFVLTRSMLDTLTKRHYKITFRSIDVISNEQRPVYIDDNFGVPLDLMVMPAYYADMQPQENESQGQDFLKIDGGTV